MLQKSVDTNKTTSNKGFKHHANQYLIIINKKESSNRECFPRRSQCKEQGYLQKINENTHNQNTKHPCPYLAGVSNFELL